METLRATAERMLLVLELTCRPLNWAELSGALGLDADHGRQVCRWLTANGYIIRVGDVVQVNDEAADTAWSLADKGRSWSKHRGVLGIPDRLQ